MTISIQATPNAAGYIELAITGAGASASITSLTRADANGTRLVRLYPSQDLSAGELYLNDAEAALTGSIVYTVITDTPETATVSTSFPVLPRAFLSPVLTPASAIEVSSVLEYLSQRENSAVVHNIINRADPIIMLGSLRTRNGSMQLFLDSYSQALAVESLLGSGEIVMLRQPTHEGMDMYFVAESTTTAVLARELSPMKWVIGVSYREVAWPIGNLRGTVGWTIASALARNATILDELTEFETVADGVVGP